MARQSGGVKGFLELIEQRESNWIQMLFEQSPVTCELELGGIQSGDLGCQGRMVTRTCCRRIHLDFLLALPYLNEAGCLPTIFCLLDARVPRWSIVVTQIKEAVWLVHH